MWHMGTPWNRFIAAHKRSLGQGNIFAPVCHSVYKGWGSASMHAGIPPPRPEVGTPPGTRGRHPPGSRHPPDQTPPPLGADTPPEADTPHEQCMLGDTGNKRAIRILLECNLVYNNYLQYRRETYEYNVLLWHNSHRFFVGSFRVSLPIDWKGLADCGIPTLYGKYINLWSTAGRLVP